MFRKKTDVSAFRFCQSATELPYAELMDYRECTVAVSKLSRFQPFPPRDAQHPAEAFGIVHSGSIFDDGSETPLLPVEIVFLPQPARCRELGFAHLEQRAFEPNPLWYVLRVQIADPDGSIFAGVETAFKNAVMSGNRFMHLRLAKSHTLFPLEDKSESLSYDERQAFLRGVDAGTGKLASMTFDEVLFHDQLTTEGPAWSHQWADDPRHQSLFAKGVEKYRASQQKWAKQRR